MPHPYDLLDVAPEVTSAELKAAYHRKLRQFPAHSHPQEFQQIRAAYETIRAAGEHRGDPLQIITSKTAQRSLDWLNFVVTPTARNRIRQWYKRGHRAEKIQRGTEMLELELGREGFDALLNGEAMVRLARRCNLVGTEDLLAALGFGGVTLHQVLNRLREEIRLATAAAEPAPSNKEVAAGITGAPQPPAPLVDLHSGSPILGVWRAWNTGWEAAAVPCPARRSSAPRPWATTASRSIGRSAPTWPRCRRSESCRCA